jgi:hypothetical protein
MAEEFVMRGKTESGQTEVLNFSGYKPGYAYRLVEFTLYPSVTLAITTNQELCGSITAGKTALAPETDVDFNNEALIGSSFTSLYSSANLAPLVHSVINDTFLITQNLILMVKDQSGDDNPVNWQCRFIKERMNGPETAATNYKQYLISDGS